MPSTDLPTRDAPTRPAETVTAWPVIAGRYEVIRLLGEGGMGRVLLAHDTNLKRDVALKALRPDLATRPHLAEQLLREGRAVAQLHHPHIATIFDVVDDAGSLYIVMEYLRGETLNTRLRRGPLALQEGIRHAIKIASALGHAHAQGIVHCDLKPGNIFLAKLEGVKVLDFGLARVLGHVRGEPSQGIGVSPAVTSNRAGTPGYMSPEQKLGLALDHRSDIYSFGIVLREMLAGSPPGAEAGDWLHASAGAVAPIIDRALAPDPAERFQSAGEIETALRKLDAASGWAPLSRFTIAAAASTMLVAALVAYLRPSPSAPLQPPVVAVSRFMSDPGDTAMAYLSTGLRDIVADDLAASNAVVAARAERIVTSAEEAAALASELGAGMVLLGRVERTDTQISVELRGFDARSHSFRPATVFRRPVEDLVGIRQALSATTLHQLGLASTRLVDPRPSREGLLPSTMDAFEEYAQARWFLERGDVAANVDHAMTILDKLIAREPNFALAHASLGEATWRKWRATKDPKWSEAALQHALEALRLSPDQPEVRYGVALIYEGIGRRAEALSEMERVARTRPTNDDAQRLMGRLYAEAGRLDEGLAALHRAVALRPGYWGNHSALGNVAYRAGLYDLAISAFERYCELRPDSASAHQCLGTAYHAAGNLDAALRSYERALKIAPNANAYSNVGTLHYDAGRYEEAMRSYARAVDLDPLNASLHRNLADAMMRAGDARGAIEQYSRAIALATAALRVNPRDASLLSLKAVGLARTGHPSEALTTSLAAVALQPGDTDVLLENALILTWAGRKADAVEVLSRAVAAGYNVKRLEKDPDLAALSELPGFRRLIGRSLPDGD